MKNTIASIMLLLATVATGDERTRDEVLADLNKAFDEVGQYYRAVGISHGEVRLVYTGTSGWQPGDALFCLMVRGGPMRRVYELASLSSVSFDGEKVLKWALKDATREGRYHVCWIPQ